MAGWKDNNLKASDICGTCNGVGTVPVERMRVEDGRSRSETVWETCPTCKGYSAP